MKTKENVSRGPVRASGIWQGLLAQTTNAPSPAAERKSATK